MIQIISQKALVSGAPTKNFSNQKGNYLPTCIRSISLGGILQIAVVQSTVEAVVFVSWFISWIKCNV